MKDDDRTRAEDQYLARVRKLVLQSAASMPLGEPRTPAELQDRSRNLAADLVRALGDIEAPMELAPFHRQLLGTLGSVDGETPRPFDRQSQKWVAILYLVGFPLPDLARPVDTMAVGTDAGSTGTQSRPEVPPSLVELLTELQHPGPEGAIARRAGRPSLDLPQ